MKKSLRKMPATPILLSPTFPMCFPENCSELIIQEISVTSPYSCKNLNGYSLGGAYLRIIFKCHFLHVAATWHLSLARLSTWWRKPNAGNDWSFCRFPNVRVEQEFSLEMVAPSFSNSQGTFPKNSLHQAEICIIFQGKMEHLATRCSPGINVNVHIVDYTYSNDIYFCTCLSSAWF